MVRWKAQPTAAQTRNASSAPAIAARTSPGVGNANSESQLLRGLAEFDDVLCEPCRKILSVSVNRAEERNSATNAVRSGSESLDGLSKDSGGRLRDSGVIVWVS
jgi:hypothetical protein